MRSLPKLKRNEYYTLIIQCEDAYNPQKFGVYTTDKNNSYLKSGTIDGQKLADGEKIAISMEFQFYNTGAFKNNVWNAYSFSLFLFSTFWSNRKV